MIYFKIVSDADQRVIGAEAIEEPTWVRWQAKHRMLVQCGRDQAEGILSDHDNDTVYTIEGRQINGVENHLTAVFISAEEYDELAALLDSGETVPATSEPPSNDGGGSETMTVAEMRATITEIDDVLNIILGVVE